MVQRCGECHPQALRTFLSLQLPEHTGQMPDTAFWKRVLVRLLHYLPPVMIHLEISSSSGEVCAIVDLASWLQEAGNMKPEQLTQLASSHHGLVCKMQQLVARRKELGRLVQTGGQESAVNQQPLLSNMAQVQ